MALSYQFLGILRIQIVIFFKDLINSSLSITYIHTYVHTYVYCNSQLGLFGCNV